MQCQLESLNIPFRPLNFNSLWVLKLLVVGVICLVSNLELASRRVVDLCGVAQYVMCGWLTKWLVGSDLFVSLGALNP
jgi:hypothetical protein